MRDSSSIYMRVVYEELGKIGKNWEKLGKSDAPIFLTVYEALHMKLLI